MYIWPPRSGAVYVHFSRPARIYVFDLAVSQIPLSSTFPSSRIHFTWILYSSLLYQRLKGQWEHNVVCNILSVCLVIRDYVFLYTSLEVFSIVNSKFFILLFVHDLLIVLIFCLPSWLHFLFSHFLLLDPVATQFSSKTLWALFEPLYLPEFSSVSGFPSLDLRVNLWIWP